MALDRVCERVYEGAYRAARRLRLQVADAQDAGQEAVLAALRARREIEHPRAYGARVALRAAGRAGARPTVELTEKIPDRSRDLRALREALDRCGAWGWASAGLGEGANIRARLVREGWAV